MYLIKEIFKGNWSLIKTFWIITILGQLLTSIPIFLGEIYYDQLSEGTAILILVFLAIYIVYFVFSTIALWNSSSKFITKKKKNNNNAFWGYAAKTYVILSVLRVVGTSLSALLT